jgi:hypothetical protein
MQHDLVSSMEIRFETTPADRQLLCHMGAADDDGQGPPWIQLLADDLPLQAGDQLRKLLHWWHICYCLSSWSDHAPSGLL